MRPWVRRGVWMLAGGVAAVAVLAAVSVGPVDDRDARRLPEFAAAVASARGAAESAVTAAAASQSPEPFRVGAGRAAFTPTVGAAVEAPERGEFPALPLAGYGNREGKPALGMADPLWAKAVAFASGGRTGVVVAADALIIPREVAALATDRILQQHGLPRGAIYFGATHTHSGPGGWGEGWVAEAFAGGFHPGVRIWMAQQLGAAVSAALADLRPASLATTPVTAPEWVRNRLVGDRGRVDPRFQLVAALRAGEPPVVIGAYAAHATVLPASEMKFSGDYPGAWQRAVERRLGGTAVFLAGPVGSHAPRPPQGGRDGAVAMGEQLAERCVAAWPTLSPALRPAFALASVEIQLPELQPRVAEHWRIRAWLARRLLPVGDRTWVQALRLGEAVWLSTPCDFSGELALDLAEHGRARGVDVTVTSFNGDYLGYVVPAPYYAMNTYETRTMAFFGPQLTPYLTAVLETLVDGMSPAPARTGRDPQLVPADVPAARSP